MVSFESDNSLRGTQIKDISYQSERVCLFWVKLLFAKIVKALVLCLMKWEKTMNVRCARGLVFSLLSKLMNRSKRKNWIVKGMWEKGRAIDSSLFSYKMYNFT